MSLNKQIVTIFLCLLAGQTPHADVTVLAAASLKNALADVITAYQKQHNVIIKPVFASSSVLAKQIENGLVADIFISADSQWMDYIEQKGQIERSSRRNFLSNTLVLIAPKGREFKTILDKGSDLAQAFSGKLCTGEPQTVPVGKYAKQALDYLGVWQTIKPRLVGTEDVRSALAFVERGECDAGIVYATDAQISDQVTPIGVFPPESHQAIHYVIAQLKQSDEGIDVFDFLNSDEAKTIFQLYGFKLAD